jgi:hypothetical protein
MRRGCISLQLKRLIDSTEQGDWPMTRQTFAFRSTLGAGFACLLASLAAAETGEHPDFTGLWTNFPGGGGFGGGGAQPSYTAEAETKIARYREVTEGTNHSPGAYCVGTGMPGSMLGSGGYPMEILQRPEQINITYEAHGEMRRIYFGDRVADPEDVFPERNGYSIGHWEGETLVVETDHLVEQVDQRYPHSAAATVVERYTMDTQEDGRRVLTAAMTMTDPEFLTEPFTTEKKWLEVPNGRIMTYECTEPVWLDVVDGLLSGEGGAEPEETLGRLGRDGEQ